MTRLLPFALLLLATVAAADVPAFVRDQWPHWSVKDCHSTRTRVLIRDSEQPVLHRDPNDKCSPISWGYWSDVYTGEIFHDPAKIDVDHLVSLSDAHRSGGWKWDRDKRRAYANDMGIKWALVVTGASTNRSKGDKGPHQWLPKSDTARCWYVMRHATLKFVEKLDASDAERAKVREVIETACQ